LGEITLESQRTVLLLNASNLKTALTYPYAFIQVSEIADRFNIYTVRKDMYGVLQDQWEDYLQKELQRKPFNMILITLRNTDAVDVNDYRKQHTNYNYSQPIVKRLNESQFYYPIELTKRLIQILRKLTDIPIVIGGYAFSSMPEKLMKYFEPDYGVVGGPDAFFEHFEDILEERNLDQIANLFSSTRGNLQRGPIKYFPPAFRPEYTEAIIVDRQAFYSRVSGENAELSVSIEVSRGCPNVCSMCSEPSVKGRKVHYRDLDVIEKEINFLRKFQLNCFFFICSEINSEGNEFVMRLADRILDLNKEREDHEKISWHALHLMNFSKDELKHIRKSGFRGDFNPLPVSSLDDYHLTATKSPLKSNDIISFFTQANEVMKEEFRSDRKKFFSLEERIFRHPKSLNTDNFVKSWNIFLGHIETTTETISVTLKRADDAGLHKVFDSCYVNKATRIYDFMKPTDEVLKNTWFSMNGVIKSSYNELWPSFTYPPALLRHFRTVNVLDDFLVLVGDTYLSQKHLFKKDWNWFLKNNLDSETFLSWWISLTKSKFDFKSFTAIAEVQDFLAFLRRNPSDHNINELFNPSASRKTLVNFTINIGIQLILFSQERELIPIMELLGLPPSLKATLNLSPYQFAVKLFERYSTKNEIFSVLNENSLDKALSRFFVEYLIYLNNTPLQLEYRIFFTHR
jgi:hypothetical protein